jgi:hypothetical protein
MSAFFPARQDLADSGVWPLVRGDAPPVTNTTPSEPTTRVSDGKGILRAGNRVDAKKRKDKKDDLLCELDARKDRLRAEALELRRQEFALDT